MTENKTLEAKILEVLKKYHGSEIGSHQALVLIAEILGT